MFDLTNSPEFMAALEKAIVVAVANAQIITPGVDPENEWLTAKEAMAFLRLGETAFRGFRQRNETKIVSSTGVNDTEPRYQLASLQQIMRDKAVGLPEPVALPVFQRHTNGHGKRPKAPATTAERQFSEPFLIK